MFAELLASYGSAFGPIGTIAGYYVGTQIDHQVFPEIGPKPASRHVIGADDGTPLDLCFNEVLTESAIIYSEKLRVYTKSGKVSVTFGADCGFTPLIEQGAEEGAELLKTWFGTSNGAWRLHYDSTRAKQWDPPHAVYGGNQVTSDPHMAAKAAARTPAQFVPPYTNQLIILWKKLHTVKYGNSVPFSQKNLWQCGNGDLADCFLALLRLCKVDTSRIDVSALVGIAVTGFKLRSPQQAGPALQALGDVYAVSMFPSDGKIKFKQRTSESAVGTIYHRDCGAVPMGASGEEPKVRIVERFAYPQDRPGTVIVKFQNSLNNHEPASIPVVLDESASAAPAELDLQAFGFAMTPDEAFAFGLRYLDEIRKSERSFETTLPHTYWGLELQDEWDLELDDEASEVVRVRIHKKEEEDPLGCFKIVAYEVSSMPINTTAPGTGGGASEGEGGEIADISAVVFSPGSDTGEPEPYPTDPYSFVENVIVIPSWPLGFNDAGGQVFSRLHGTDEWTPGPEFVLSYPIGVTASDMAAADDPLVFETRPVSVVLAHELELFDELGSLIDTTEEQIEDGYAVGAETSNLSLVDKEIGCFQDAELTGALGDKTYDLENWFGGINGSNHGAHSDPVRFARIPHKDDLIRLLFPGRAGQQVDIAVIAPGDEITTFYTVTLGAPSAPWDPGPASVADQVRLVKDIWAADGTQILIAHPTWDSSLDVEGQAPWGRFSTSTNNGADWTVRGYGAAWPIGISSGTMKFRFEPRGDDGSLGTAIYSTNHTYEDPPSGGGGGGSSSRGTRMIHASTGTGTPITADVLTEVDTVCSTPAGLISATMQMFRYRLTADMSNDDEDYDYQLTVNGDVLCEALNIVRSNEQNQLEVVIDILVRDVGATGELYASGHIVASRLDGETDYVEIKGSLVLDTADALDFASQFRFHSTAVGRSMTPQHVSLEFVDTVGSGADPSVLAGAGLVENGAAIDVNASGDFGIEVDGDEVKAKVDGTSIGFNGSGELETIGLNFVTREIPSGSINGSNTAFVLANTPIAGSETGYLNGLVQRVGGSNDYTISGPNITYVTAPVTGDTLEFSYRY